MSQKLLEKMNDIETLLLEINSKIDNFIGFEDLSEEERKEIELTEKEIESGGYFTFHEVEHILGNLKGVQSQHNKKRKMFKRWNMMIAPETLRSILKQAPRNKGDE